MNVTQIVEPIRSRVWLSALFAGVVIMISWGGHILFADVLRAFPFVLPMTAVTFVAFVAGTRLACLTVLFCGAMAQYYAVPPFHSFGLIWPLGYIAVVSYAGLCSIVVSLMHGMFAANAEARASEQSLQRLNEGLETRVADRTADLVRARDALRRANQSLEARVEARVAELKLANEEIQRFAYIVSHDLRAPLVNVLGFTSELDALGSDLSGFLRQTAARAPDLVTADLRAAIETDLPEALGFIRTSTQKMDRLINAILRLSREGRRKLTPEPIDVAALVKAQGESLSQQLTARDARLVVEGELPPLVSDKLAVEQIFGNLIENAVKYLTPARPGRITVSGGIRGSISRFAIADNGRGIEAKDFERVFDLFRRSGVQDTRGEGIGLAFVRNLVRRLGGEISLVSDFGRGSVFTVELPTHLEPQREDAMLRDPA